MADTIDVTVGGVSIWLWMVVATYFLGLRLVFFDQRFADKQVGQDAKRISAQTGLIKPLIGYLTSAGLIFFAAPMVARSANQLAELMGVGNTFFGTLFLSLCTTPPELVAGLTAVRMRAFALVVGNALGPSPSNLLLLAPIDFAYDGSLMAAASAAHVVTCFAAILLSRSRSWGGFTTPSGALFFSSPTRC